MANESHEYEECWEQQGHQIIACKTCGFKHIYPIPKAQDLECFYRDSYFTEVKPFPGLQYTDEQIRRIRHSVEANKEYLHVFNTVDRYRTSPGTKMLDIGCGVNLLSLLFLKRDWTALAVEPSQLAAEYLKKYDIPVLCQPVDALDQMPMQDISFVNMQFVLEHLRNPREVLEKVYAAMEPGGIIHIRVPNDFSPGQMAFQQYHNEQLRWVCLPDHINYFTFDSLSRLLADIGFIEVHRTTNFPLEFLLLTGVNYYADPAAADKVGSIIRGFEDAFGAAGRSDDLAKLYEALAAAGFGRSIYMFARKE